MTETSRVKRVFGEPHMLSKPQNRATNGPLISAVRAFAVLLLCACLPAAFLAAQEPRPGEYQVKAAYLYNFSRFVEWPAQIEAIKNTPFEICVLGKDPFGPVLDSILSGEAIGGSSLVAKRISKPEEALACRVVFVGTSEESHLKDIVTVLDKASVLTVSDIPKFSERGGMIGFVLDGDKVRFEVNVSNAMDAGLTVSSDLLKVAVAVKRNSQPGA